MEVEERSSGTETHHSEPCSVARAERGPTEKQIQSRKCPSRTRTKGKTTGESKDDIKDYAETTMNELLGWYGYGKAVGSKDTDKLDLKRFASNDPATDGHNPPNSKVKGQSACPQTEETPPPAEDVVKIEIQVENMPKSPKSPPGQDYISAEDSSREKDDDDDDDDEDEELVVDRTHEEVLDAADDGDMDPQIKIESDEASNHSISDNENNNSCAWCLKSGAKTFTHSPPSLDSPKTYCSELCFTLSRRASIKNTKVCDWCKHIRHTVTYVDFTDGDRQLQFCSQKCLNQYKMNIFCKETQEHLQQLQVQPGAHTPATNNANSNSSMVSPSDVDDQQAILITPDLWTNEDKQVSKQSEERKEPHKKPESPLEEGKTRMANDAVHVTPIRKTSSSRCIRPPVTSAHETIIVSPKTSSCREERTKHWPPHRTVSERVKKEKPHDMTSSTPMSQTASSPRLSRDTPSSATNSNAGVTPAGLSELGLSNVAQFSMFDPMAGHPNPLLYNPFMNAGMPSTGPGLPPNFNPFALPPPNLNRDGNGAPSDPTPRPDAFGPHHFNPMACHFFPPCVPPMPPGLPPLPPGVALPPRMGPSGQGLLPPNTLMTPYPYLVPFPVPVPIPIPVPPKAYKKFMEKHNLPIPAEDEEEEEEDDEEEEKKVIQQSLVPEEGRSKSADVADTSRVTRKIHVHASKKERSSRCSEMDSACNSEKIMCACCQNVDTLPDASPTRPIKPGASDGTRPRSSQSLPVVVQPEHSISFAALTPQSDGVIDLSSKKARRTMTETDQETNRNGSRLKRSPSKNQDERIAINLSSLPNPADNSYSSRRRMILDAPPTAKSRKRSPSPENRLYYSLPSREIYGKRRCIRARIKSK